MSGQKPPSRPGRKRLDKSDVPPTIFPTNNPRARMAYICTLIGLIPVLGLPFGLGATESGLPGYFAANNFFNSTSAAGGNWYVTGQIKAPDRSMYVVDSVAGETIDPDGAVGGPWDNPMATATNSVSIPRLSQVTTPNVQVDFRYNGACLMLMLDGHAQAEAPWRDLNDLQTGRRIKVQNLTQN